MNKQLSIFNQDTNAKAPKVSWKLYIDGASRSNPGPAGAGIHVLKDGQTIEKRGFYLGRKTNNEAEYLALLLGLYVVKPYMHPDDELTIISDSQLLIRQLNGVYRVKDEKLIALYRCAQGYIGMLRPTFLHVLREHNKVADAQANLGIDKKIAIPEDFMSFCKAYAITFSS